MMRALLLIVSLVAVAGCNHSGTSWRSMPSDVAQLEEEVTALQDEVVILTRALATRRENLRLPETEHQRRTAAAATARESYPRTQRVRDLRVMGEILRRQIAALSAELEAYSDGPIYDAF